MHRRDVLCWLAVSTQLSAAGCTSSLPGLSEDAPGSGSDAERSEETPCDEYVYRATAADQDDAYPWDLHIRNVGLSVYSVTIEISELSGESSDAVVSCSATSERHAALMFDLSPDKRYRVHVTLNRPEDAEEATATVRWGQVTKANAALEVTVDRGEGFEIRHVHYDPGITVTPTP